MQCKANPEHDKFIATAVEHHWWIVDNDGEYLKDDGIYDAELIEVTECAICGSEIA
jgi:hypothetical protein